MTKKIIIGIAVLLLLIQLVRVDKVNPPVEANKDFIALTHPPKDIEALLIAACYDCHSNQTVYPWYFNVAPISWWAKHHVNEGREHLNFSTWADYSKDKQYHKLDECHEEVEEGEMPLQSYTITHSDAILSQAQKEKLADWFLELKKK